MGRGDRDYPALWVPLSRPHGYGRIHWSSYALNYLVLHLIWSFFPYKRVTYWSSNQTLCRISTIRFSLCIADLQHSVVVVVIRAIALLGNMIFKSFSPRQLFFCMEGDMKRIHFGLERIDWASNFLNFLEQSVGMDYHILLLETEHLSFFLLCFPSQFFSFLAYFSLHLPFLIHEFPPQLCLVLVLCSH